MSLKESKLREILAGCGSVCVGYSGGVDSVYLAKTPRDVLGSDRMIAVLGVSASLPQLQRDIALQCAHDFEIPLAELPTDEMSDPN